MYGLIIKNDKELILISTQHKKIAVIRLQGGLGNQLFQYLFGISCFLEHEFDLCFDCSPAFGVQQTRPFTLIELGLPGNFFKAESKFSNTSGESVIFITNIEWLESATTFRVLEQLVLPVVNENRVSFNYDLDVSQEAYYQGYWQSSLYWEEADQLLRQISIFLNAGPLALKINAIANQLEIQTDICAVHIRGGDYLKSFKPQYHGQCHLHYFERAMKESGATRFHIYTDDINYASNLLSGIDNLKYISSIINNDLIEFVLLTRYRKVILSNSSFSYLAARIATAREASHSIYAPYPWYSFKDTGPEIPNSWDTLNRVTGTTDIEDGMELQYTTVSVVLTINGYSVDLYNTIKSVLEQSHPPIEILLCPVEASAWTQNEIESIFKKNPNIRLLEPSSNPASARNKGVLQAAGEYIAFLETTHSWEKSKIYSQLRTAIRMRAELIYSQTFPSTSTFESAQEFKAFSQINQSWERTLSVQNPFTSISNLIVRRNVLIEVGLFDETLLHTHEHDMWRRLALEETRIVVMDENLSRCGFNSLMDTNTNKLIASELAHLDKIVQDLRTPSGMSIAYLERLMSPVPAAKPRETSLSIEPINPPEIDQLLSLVRQNGLNWSLLIRLNKSYLCRYAVGNIEQIKSLQNLRAIKNNIIADQISKKIKNEVISIHKLLQADKQKLIEYFLRMLLKSIVFTLSVLVELPLYIKKKITTLINQK